MIAPVIDYARQQGFDAASDLTQHGNDGIGNVFLKPMWHLEVKTGEEAEKATTQRLRLWLAEAARGGSSAGPNVKVDLIVQVKGVGPSHAQYWLALTRTKNNGLRVTTLDSLLNNKETNYHIMSAASFILNNRLDIEELVGI